MEELYKDWDWTERFPSRDNVLQYFRYVDEKLGLSKDIMLNTRADAASFDSVLSRWRVLLSTGKMVICQFFVICAGYASKPYIPDFSGLDNFKGIMHHTGQRLSRTRIQRLTSSGLYPKEGIVFKDKRVAVIGTGASGVQCIQEIARDEVTQLTVFQRTPNLCLPMNQQVFPKLEAGYERDKTKEATARTHEYRRGTYAGMVFDLIPRSGLDDEDDEREAVYESLWSKGGFNFWLGAYQDMYVDPDVNCSAYRFWREKTRARVFDPAKKDLLAPMRQPHPFGVKRPSLEQCYYEVLNQDNVDIIDINRNQISAFTETGIEMKNGDQHPFDIILLATGFDSVTGGLCNIRIFGADGTLLRDKWAEGCKTSLGVATAGFPNMFLLYGPQAPTAFANGPTFVELQGDWINDAITYCVKNGKKTIECTTESEIAWTKNVAELNDATLFPLASSWYMGHVSHIDWNQSTNYNIAETSRANDSKR
jgi:cation diffusion facilitator CzcD-associated flavoprotein CzcO